MEKKIQDYLHLYVGCLLQINQEGTLQLKSLTGLEYRKDNTFTCWCNGTGYNSGSFDCKPMLRQLIDMKGEDIKAWSDNVFITVTPYCVELDSKDDSGEFTEIYPDGSILSRSKDDGEIRPINGGLLFRILLSKGFDLFGLIESGLAIDKTTLAP